MRAPVYSTIGTAVWERPTCVDTNAVFIVLKRRLQNVLTNDYRGRVNHMRNNTEIIESNESVGNVHVNE